jgi:hypothetical protein
MGSKVQFYNYLQLVGKDTNYAKRMTRLRNRIFGDPVRPTSAKGMKVFFHSFIVEKDK